MSRIPESASLTAKLVPERKAGPDFETTLRSKSHNVEMGERAMEGANPHRQPWKEVVEGKRAGTLSAGYC